MQSECSRLQQTMDRTAHFYASPSYVGSGFPVFAGSRRQRGGNIFGAIARAVLPTLKTVGKRALSSLGRQGIGLAKDVALDAFRGRNVVDSLKARAPSRVRNVVMEGVKGFTNSLGSPTSAPKPSRKRRNTAKKRPPAKKHRPTRKANF